MSIYQSTKVSPYVYQLTHKTTGQFYIGYREVNKVPSDQDLGFFYWTSSKKIDELGFENFDFQIIAEFFDGDSAWRQEQRIIEANIKNPLCLNGHFIKDGNNKFSFVGKFHSDKNKAKMLGRKVSDETRAKNSIAATNPSQLKREQIAESNRIRICSKETRDKMSIIHKNPPIETREKMSASAKTRPLCSIETRSKMSSNTTGANNPRAKKWKMSFENGATSIIINDLTGFCKDHCLNYRHMLKTSKHGGFYDGKQISLYVTKAILSW